MKTNIKSPDWNTPKHLAKFDWHHGEDGSTTVKVYPHDTTGDDRESIASVQPFFQATFKPVRYAPKFPMATRWANYLGFDTTLVMPPLPQGEGAQGELPGTDRWCSLVPMQYSRRTVLGWFDMQQQHDESGKLVGGGGEHKNFWPGLGRWQLGVKMEDADLSFDHPLDMWQQAKPPPIRSNL